VFGWPHAALERTRKAPLQPRQAFRPGLANREDSAAEGAPIDCTVIDLSAGGACLDLPDPERLPPRFTLLHGATRKSCLIKWKKFRRIGVQF